MKTPIHNNYDDEYQDQEEEDEFVDSCSCTDVTLDETLKINHNHRKSMARKKKLQTQRLRELQKVLASQKYLPSDVPRPKCMFLRVKRTPCEFAVILAPFSPFLGSLGTIQVDFPGSLWGTT